MAEELNAVEEALTEGESSMSQACKDRETCYNRFEACHAFPDDEYLTRTCIYGFWDQLDAARLMLDALESVPDLEPYNTNFESTAALQRSFSDRSLGGESLTLIETSKGDVSVPVGDWLYE